MNQKFMKNILLAGLIAVSTQVNATGFNKTDINSAGNVMQGKQFDEAIANTKAEEVATKFGFPDQILTLKTPQGEIEGVVWVYKSAVQKADGIKDARFVFIQGEMKYVALSNAA